MSKEYGFDEKILLTDNDRITYPKDGPESIDFKSLLDYIDPDCNYTDWLNVGMGLKDAWNKGADVDVNTFEEWSAAGAKYRPGEPAKKWKSFDDTRVDGITYKTVLLYAKEGGCDLASMNQRNGSKGVRQEEKKRETKKETTNKIQEMNEKKKLEILEALNGLCFEKQFNHYLENLENDSLFNSTIAPRGISKETAQKYNIFPAENVVIGNETFNRGVMFYGSQGSYIFRNSDYEANGKGKYKFRKPAGIPFIPLGLKQVIDQKDKTIDGHLPAPVFLCEGVFDAPAFSEAAPDIDAIALAGTDGIDPVIIAYKEHKINRPLIVALDNDGPGQENQKKVCKKLENAGIPCLGINIIPDDLREGENSIKDANDFLLTDKDRFRESLEDAQEEYYNKSKINDFLPVKYYMNTFIDHVTENANAPVIETGFESLDSEDLLGGGLYPGLYIIGAISSLGKTTLTLQIADQIAAAGHDVMFFSLEMSRDEIIAKSISRYTAQIADLKAGSTQYATTTRGILNARDYEFYPRRKLKLIGEAQEAYINDEGGNLYIVEGEGNISADTIRQKALIQKGITGKAPVIFVDYLQILMAPGGNQRLSDKQIVDANVFELKRLSRELNIPVFAVSSLNRDNYTKKISMVAFKESGAIEYTSDVLLGLEREVDPSNDNDYKKACDLEYQTGIKNLRLKVLKNRNGKQGGAALLTYNALFNYYYDDRIEGEAG